MQILRAQTVEDAAFRYLNLFARNVWEETPADIDLPTTGQIYVERPAPYPNPASPSRRMRTLLLKTPGFVKIYLTGQIGSGKSMELWKMSDDQDIKSRFEQVRIVLSQVLELQAPGMDIRFVLIAIAEALASHIVTREYHKKSAFLPDEVSIALKRWVQVFEAELKPPETSLKLDSMSVDLKAGISTIRVNLKTEERLRKAFHEQISVSEILVVIREFIHWIKDSSDRDLLILVDDSDKIKDMESAEKIFCHHAGILAELPCRAIFTVPYALHLRPAYNQVRLYVEEVLLKNIKVIDRQDPDRVLDEGVLFFRKLLDRLLDPEAGLLDDATLRETVRLSAGIPREFLRILQKTFELAYFSELARLDIETVRSATVDLCRDMIPQTQTSEVRGRLKAIWVSKELDQTRDQDLLQSLLAIELVNRVLWYDVHPLLQPYIASLVQADRPAGGRELT